VVSGERSDRSAGELRDSNARAADARSDVVEILAGAVLELLLARPLFPSPDQAQSLPRAPKSATSHHIRGSL